MKRITIYDVAKEANVSLATVSRVINDSDVVRSDTKDKVQAAIDRLGYKPNAIAQGLALQKTTNIALVIPESSMSYTGQIINGLINVAKIYKYNIVLHNTTEGINEIDEIVETIIKSRVDGAIIFNYMLEQTQLDLLKKYQIPVVTVGYKINQDLVGSVSINYEKLAYELTMKYIKNNKKDIVLIEDRKNNCIINQLNDGIKKAYSESNIDYKGIINIPNNYRSSYLFLKDYFKDNKHDLVITYRDSQTLAVSNAARENGINIAEDMELVCILDNKYNSMVRPQISGYSIPEYDLGAVAMRVMTKMLNDNGDDIDKSYELSYLFIQRETTKNYD